MKSLHVTMLVSNDLVFDQRVAKVCDTLTARGFTITLVGRKFAGSPKIHRAYQTIRFRLPFRKGILFYASLNLRLFFYLLFAKMDIIHANDLDTLLPAYLVATWRKKKIVYDSHEYFTGAEGLTGRKFQKWVWESIEKRIFPKLKNVFTVNRSIASIYSEKYNVPVKVMRNIPIFNSLIHVKSREELGLPGDKKIIILQGAYIDPDRGGMEAVEAMQFLENVLLLIVGSGRDMENLKRKRIELGLEDKIRIFPRMPYEELRHYTTNADLGLSLDKPVHLNYTYSLPNKLFDYIHAGIPVLASDLPELRTVILERNVGAVLSKVTPEDLAEAVRSMLESGDYAVWKRNAIEARKNLNWQNECMDLINVYQTFL
ncbi:MAG: glycosyltransferase [Crocinitomicaceae bacterium]|nr:glycosyltransferase [Crocinitomicaceae bacterium]